LDHLGQVESGFDVIAQSRVDLRAIRHELVYQRSWMAYGLVGGRIPTRPAVKVSVVYERAEAPAKDWSEFTSADGKLTQATVRLSGPLSDVLAQQIPKQMTHLVLAEYFGRPVPSWLDAGLAELTESQTVQAGHDTKLRELLKAGHALRLRSLFKMIEYPRDVEAFRAQGYSVIQFLRYRPVVSREPKLTFDIIDANQKPNAVYLDDRHFSHFVLIEFVRRGITDGWDAAAKEVYGLESVDDLEEAWIEWLRKPQGKTIAKAQKPEEARIPPVDIPPKR
jgi:hypothetical protein